MKKFEEIYNLAANGILWDEPYKQILNEMSLPELSEYDNSVGIELQANMDEERNNLENISDSYSKMPFWSDYLYWQLWKKIRYDSLGHVVSLKTYRSRYEIEISVGLDIRKDELESKEDYDNRKKQILDSSPYQWEKYEKINKIAILDTDENKEKYLEYLSGFMDIIRYSFETRDNKLQTIKVICKNIHVELYVKETEKKLDKGMLEYIMKQIKEVAHAKATVKYIPTLESIANHIYASTYYDLCKKLGVNNENTKKYEEMFLKNRNKNRETRDMAEEIGKTYSSEAMFNCIKEIGEMLENYLQVKYCIYLDSIYYKGKSLNITFFFSRILMNCFDRDDLNNAYVFDEITVPGKDKDVYIIPIDKINYVINTMNKDIGIEKVYIDSKNEVISSGEEIICINKISGEIDIKKLYDKLINNEKG